MKSGLTQDELSDRINFSQVAISNWENSNRDIDSAMYIKLAEFYGVSIDYLLGVSDNPAHGDNDSIAKVHIANDIRDSHVYQGNTKFEVNNRRSKRSVTKPVSFEAGELVNIYEKLDLKRRVELLQKAFSLEGEMGDNTTK